jgi:hypothetical protein
MRILQILWNRVERQLRGHRSIGPVTMYGANAMHWAVNISTRRWGYVCFRLPLPCDETWWPLYFYCSPNATPWAATFFRGRDAYDGDLRDLARLRRRRFGHAFDTDRHSEELRALNGAHGR